MAAHTLFFLLGKHSWQHIPAPFFWANTHGSTLLSLFFWANTHGSIFHLPSSGSTLMAAHSISFLLGKHSRQHTPSLFFWAHTHGSTLILVLGQHPWKHTNSYAWMNALSCFCKLSLEVRWHETQGFFYFPFYAYIAYREILCSSLYLSFLSFCLSKPRTYHTISPLPCHALLRTLCQFHASVFAVRKLWALRYLEFNAASPRVRNVENQTICF